MKKLVMFLFFLFFSFIFTPTTHGANHKNTIHIVAFGDSITYGSGDPYKRGYIERVSAVLETERQIPVRVNNFAKPKSTTDDLLEQLSEKNIRKKTNGADYIFLYIGTNDFRKSAKYQFCQVNRVEIMKGKNQFSSNLRKILRILREENEYAPIFVLGLYHPYTELENRSDLLELLEDWNRGIMDAVASTDRSFYVPTLDLFIY